ncbi:PEP-CTERM sorting domain-containing protein [Opitutaceae bacterium TAV4]|nr:PEP-CTERM sorting domain-containing protein [Opitutaceae bacterium TAV4]RRK02193.1 PEP-CTERM sorting domain-containing protein [Opitutaceae bacterium TAV3]
MNLIPITSRVRRAALPCLLACLASANAASGAIISFENAAVTPETFLSNTTTISPVTINLRYSTDTNNRWVGFAFSAPEAANLTSVSFKLNAVQSGALGADVKISIVSLNGLTSVTPATTTGEPSFGDTVLYSETGTTPASYNGTDTHITFTLSTPFLLEKTNSKGDTIFYGVVLSFTSSEANRQIDLSASTKAADNTNTGTSFYSNNGLSDGGAGWTTSARAMNFVMNATPIPEPASTVALLAGGAVVCALVARRKRRLF